MIVHEFKICAVNVFYLATIVNNFIQPEKCVYCTVHIFTEGTQFSTLLLKNFSCKCQFEVY